MDHILAMVQASYTTPEPAGRDTQALTDVVSVAIPLETFILFTSVTLREEEMVVYTPSYRHPIPGMSTLLPFINGALATVFALTCLMVGKRVMDPRRSYDPLSQLSSFGASHQPSTRLSPFSLPSSEKQALA